VHEAPSGATVGRNGDVLVSGRVFAHHEPCKFPKLDQLEAPTTNGWVEWGATTAHANAWGFSWFSAMTGDMQVPTNPTMNGGLVYFFFSLEPLVGNAILQPVLQWGNNGGFGGNNWNIASWYVDTSTNTVLYSTPASVPVGDVIHGGIWWGNGCTNAGVCDWVIGADANSGVNSYLNLFNGIVNHTFNYAQNGVLEAYNITNCHQYPASNSVTFSNIVLDMPGPAVSNYNDVTTSQTWSSGSNGVTPSCHFSVTQLTRGVRLNFSP